MTSVKSGVPQRIAMENAATKPTANMKLWGPLESIPVEMQTPIIAPIMTSMPPRVQRSSSLQIGSAWMVSARLFIVAITSGPEKKAVSALLVFFSPAGRGRRRRGRR